ncbi:MAG: acetate uptake transporter [Candidatus Bathyarchaeota archaeon]|nr:MAG: acetate uptake transporter [Candidatus Bathyarchaeota archaeon]
MCISEVDEVTVKLTNPAPLGLLGFGMTTVLLNLHNAGFYPLNSMILAMGLAYGGLAQVIAGVMEYRKGNTFGTVAFCSYGLFWWSLVLLLTLPRLEIFDFSVSSPLQATNSAAMAAYFFMWGLFTLTMFFGTLRTNRALQFVFLSLAVLFFLLTAKELTANTDLSAIAGYEGIICGLSAFYLAVAEVLNEMYGKTLLPV